MCLSSARGIAGEERGFSFTSQNDIDTAACKTAIKSKTTEKTGLSVLVACAQTLASAAANATGNHRRDSARPAVIAAANNAAFTRVRELASDHRASHRAHEMHSKCNFANEIGNTGSLRKLEKSKRERIYK